MNRLILTLALLYAVHVNVYAQNPPANIAAELQDILDNALPNEQNSGGVLGVHVPGQWSWYGASGHAIAGVTSGQPASFATPQHQFRAGSISKLFTAVAIFQLQDDGLLGIYDPISQYLRPSLVNDTIPHGSDITIFHLLSHTSGLGDAAANDSCQSDALNDLTRTFSLEENVFCGSQFAALPPDIFFSYSNTNYALLAMIIEEVSGMDFPSYVEANIFQPAGMNATYIPGANEDQITNPHMGAYWWISPGSLMVDLTVVDASLYTGWADAVSTTADLMLFYEQLRNDQLISASARQAMFTMPSLSSWYGLGTELLDLDGDDYFGHSGEVGNTSGLYFCDIQTAEFPNGYYISYNFNYQGVDFINGIDYPVYHLLNNPTVNTTEKIVPELSSLFVAPNPANDFTTIQLQSNQYSSCILTIHDVSGKEVGISRMIDIQPGSNTIPLDLSEFESGVYLFTLTNANQRLNGSIIVTE